MLEPEHGHGHGGDLAPTYAVTKEQIRCYRDKGYVHLENVLSQAEIRRYRGVIRNVAYGRFGDVPAMDDREWDDFSRIFLQTFNIREVSSLAADFILAPRFGRIVADLMDVSGIRIYYDKPMFKEPESRITPWHQDGPHWPLYSDNVVTMWVPLVDIDESMGVLRFAAGTHRHRGFGPKGIHTGTQLYYEEHIRAEGIEGVQVPVKAGDVTVHNHWTLHGAGRNTTNRVREVMGMTFYEDGLKIDDSACDKTHGPIIDACLGNRRPGELADSPRNQVVYRNDTVISRGSPNV